MRRNKTMIPVICALLGALALSGCGAVKTSQSATFNVDTGDAIEVTLDTTDGYSLSQGDGTIDIKKGDDIVLQAAFQTPDQLAANEEAIRGADGIEIVTDDGKMLSYDYPDGAAGPEVGYLFMVDQTNTGVYAASLQDRTTADAAFEKLTFAKAE